MKYFLLFIVITCHLNLGLAHNPHECFFDIKIEKQNFTITAEFPWTLRNALIQQTPALKNAKSNIDFEIAFEQYLMANLILKNNNGQQLPFKGFKTLDNSGHSHQNSYVLQYEGSDVKYITNTIMFDISDKQVNYHSLVVDGQQKTFETYVGHNSFMIDDIHDNDNWYINFAVLTVGILGCIVYKYRTISKK